MDEVLQSNSAKQVKVAQKNQSLYADYRKKDRTFPDSSIHYLFQFII